MGKPKELCLLLPLAVYPYTIFISMGQTDETLKKELNRFLLTDEDIEQAMFETKTVQGFFHMFSNNASIIRLKNYPDTPKDLGTMAHEIFHAATLILQHIGMKLVIGKSDEAYAYLVSFITEEIFKHIKK